ncbi:MAG TPA: NAD(+) diphosphatase [Spirochaetia bacterium]|nr:NAD(+) diphosphatase [Spirochaetia bacterium]
MEAAPTPPTALAFSGQDILLPGAGAPGLLEGGPAAALSRDFAWEGRSYRAFLFGEAEAAALEAGGASRLPVRQALAELGQEEARPLLRGLALLRWLETARHCGACGGLLEDCPPEGEEPGGRRCPACGRVFFPRISPAVILLITKGGKILLAHNARFPAGRFGLIAGFVEAGETLEETAIREAREEAGIEIGGLRYLRSQPWPFPDSLMFAFRAEWRSGEARPDGREIEELRWCGPDELPTIPPSGSIARALIDEFEAEARGRA